MTGKKQAEGDRNLFAEERRQRILDTLATDSRVLVNDLSDRFGVSSATLRNDLRDLEASGLLRRTHGGAVAIEGVAIEHSAEAALSEHQDAKASIGAYAATLVNDGDVLFCDSGSTTYELIRALPSRRRATIITNDCVIAVEAERRLPESTVIMLGGTLRTGFHYAMGAATVAAAGTMSAPTAFLAATAFSFDRGFSVPTVDLAVYKQKLIERSEHTVMLMDSSKFGTFSTVSFAELDEVSTLVTDKGLDGHLADRLKSAPGAPDLVLV